MTNEINRWSQSHRYQVGILGSCIVINLVNSNLEATPLENSDTLVYHVEELKIPSTEGEEKGFFIFL